MDFIFGISIEEGVCYKVKCRNRKLVKNLNYPEKLNCTLCLIKNLSAFNDGVYLSKKCKLCINIANWSVNIYNSMCIDICMNIFQKSYLKNNKINKFKLLVGTRRLLHFQKLLIYFVFHCGR